MSKERNEKLAKRGGTRRGESVTLQELLDAAKEGLDFRRELNERLKALEPATNPEGIARCR